MSYLSGFGGAAALGAGIGYYGLSGTFPIRQQDSSMRGIQEQLQRLGYLQPGTGVYGADGKFGPRTATALRGAAAYVGWTGAAYTPANAGELTSGSVTVPDDLVDRLRAARPNPSAPYAGGGAPAPADAAVEPSPERHVITTIGPEMDKLPSGGGSKSSWLVPAAIAGGVLLLGGVVAWRAGKKPGGARTERPPKRLSRKTRRSSRRRRRRSSRR